MNWMYNLNSHSDIFLIFHPLAGDADRRMETGSIDRCVGIQIKDEMKTTVNTKLTKGKNTWEYIHWIVLLHDFQPPIHSKTQNWLTNLGCFLGHVYEYDRIPQCGNSAVSTISHGHVYFYFSNSTMVFHWYSHTLLRSVVQVMAMMSYSCSMSYKNGTPSPEVFPSCNTSSQLQKWREYLTS